MASVTSFLWTVERNFDKMKVLLTETPSMLNVVGVDGETPMGAAAHNGQMEAVEFLLSQGLELDLFAACTMGWRADSHLPGARTRIGPRPCTPRSQLPGDALCPP